MASFTSLVSLGSGCSCSSGQIEGPRLFVRRVPVSKNYCSFREVWIGRRWSYVSICKFSVTTEVIAADQGADASVSLDSSYGGSKAEGSDLTLRPAPRPVLKPKVEPVVRINSVGSGSWDASKVGGGSDRGKLIDEEERGKVIESLGEVLEQVEKLETSASASASAAPVAPVQRVITPPTNSSVDQRNVRRVGTKGVVKKTMKSVWRKGNPVATLGKVKEIARIPVATAQNVGKGVSETVKPVEDESKTGVAGIGNIEKPVVAPLRPPDLPLRVQPTLQARPSVAPPPPIVKKSVILMDVGSAPRPLARAAKLLTTDGTDEVTIPKERKPILIDKFSSKKLAVDSPTSQAVATPKKPGKISGTGRLKEDIGRKDGGPGGLRRRKLKTYGHEDEMKDAAKARKGRAGRKLARLQAARDAEPVKAEILEIGEAGMLTEELAFNLATSEAEIFGYLHAKGIRLNGAQALDKDIVKMVCKEYGVEVIDAAPTRVEEMAKKKEIFDEDDLDKLEDRPPVLTIMGHVDHGKTTLLDFIRKSKVAASEAGGITQGIGAYKVQVPVDGKLKPCVFLDTPGHEAFGAMRARGARVTDIAVIVVAADDGIRPQTSEAIAHAKAAGVPIVIGINKIDKDGANPERVMEELSSIGLMPEDWGGDIPMVKISALKGENVDDLLETVMLVAELQELKANPHRNAKGTVIEAGLDKAKGPVATFIVQNGTLKVGDIVVCGEAFGKVRALFDDGGKRVKEAGPSIPIQVIGLNNVPCAGDEFEVVDVLDIAREKAELHAESLRNERMSTKAGDGKVTLSSFASAVSSGRHVGLDLHQLNMILKVDLQGSIEAVRQALQRLPQDNVTLKFILQAAGDVSKSDVDLAVSTQAIIFGFNVKAAGSVKTYADHNGVEIRLYKVIYELIDDVRTAMEGLLEPVEEQVPIGSAEVRAVFSSGSDRIAGSMVTEGKVTKDCGVRVLRKGKRVFVGNLDSLRRIKENVKEVGAGLECGIRVDDFDDWVIGDIIETFTKVAKRRTLEEASASMAAAKEEVGI